MRRWCMPWVALGLTLSACSGGSEIPGEPGFGGSASTPGGAGSPQQSPGDPVGGNSTTPGGRGGNPPANAGSGPTGQGGNGNGSGGQPPNGAGGGIIQPPPPPDELTANQLLPSRVRRLSNAEFDATIKALTGTTLTPGKDFAPDTRQGGFTVNDAQRIDAVVAQQVFKAARDVAADVKANRLSQLAPCSNAQSEGEACAKTFIQSFGTKVYRRPIAAEEAEGLLAVYREGAKDATYADGIELVVRAALQSAGLLYLTEIGDGAPSSGGMVALSPYELASSLSYLITGGPPDATLMEAAAQGALSSATGRDEQVWRLLNASTRGGPVARDRLDRLVRIVREWFGTDRIQQTDKDANIYREYKDLQGEIEKESTAFVAEVLAGEGTVEELLSANWTVADQRLAQLYGAGGSGRVNVPSRRGLLNQAAFLATYAHAHESAPVLRGVAIARRVACINVPPPSDLGVIITVPAPDPTLTTRERFSQHSSDPSCANCHNTIDPIGFTFEQFDGMGKHRTMDGPKPVNSSATIAIGSDFDGTYADSNQLAVALAASAQVRECVARQVFRASAARSDPSVSASEAAFVELWKRLPAEQQSNILSTLIEFVKSPLFTHRRGL